MSNKVAKTILKAKNDVTFIDILSYYDINKYLSDIINSQILNNDELMIKNNIICFINNINKNDVCIQTDPIIDNEPDTVIVNTVKIVEFIKDNIKYIKRIEKKETIHTTIITAPIQ